MTDLENTGPQSHTMDINRSGHAWILNEYGWLWLNRDGSPTEITKGVWDHLLPNGTAEQRFSTAAYLLGGLTEYWRAHRGHAAVMHFVYLTSSYPGAYTSDHFRDLEKLELEPHFADYVEQAFKPLGVYIDFWHEEIKAKANQRLTVMMINDDYEAKSGKLLLTLEKPDGAVVASMEEPFELAALGQQSYQFDFPIPDVRGDFLLKATAQSTISRRRVKITNPERLRKNEDCVTLFRAGLKERTPWTPGGRFLPLFASAHRQLHTCYHLLITSCWIQVPGRGRPE